MTTATASKTYEEFKEELSVLLANLFKLCLAERKHLKKLEVDLDPDQDEVLHGWFQLLTNYMLHCNDEKWNVNLAESPPPKLPDEILIRLVMFVVPKDKTLDDVVCPLRNGYSKQKKVLKELALRLS